MSETRNDQPEPTVWRTCDWCGCRFEQLQWQFEDDARIGDPPICPDCADPTDAA